MFSIQFSTHFNREKSLELTIRLTILRLTNNINVTSSEFGVRQENQICIEMISLCNLEIVLDTNLLILRKFTRTDSTF